MIRKYKKNEISTRKNIIISNKAMIQQRRELEIELKMKFKNNLKYK